MKVKCLKCGKERNVRADAITSRHNSFKHDICDKENSQTYISNNVTKFAEHHGLQPSCISKCLHGIRRYTGTFVFEFFCPPFIPAYAFNNPNVIKEFYY